MPQFITPLEVLSYRTVPEVAKEFFPTPEEGYLFFLEDKDKKDSVEVWLRDFSKGDFFVEAVTPEVAKNMKLSVESWNQKEKEKRIYSL